MSYDKTQVIFVDTETTGLNPHIHEVWEIGMIADDYEYEWQLPVNLGMAEPGALRVGRFYERRWPTLRLDAPSETAEAIAMLTANRHLVGAVPWFDASFLESLLRKNGYIPAWHYHLIDVEALAVGHVGEIELPWSSDHLSEQVGVVVPVRDRHTALGDARWAKAIFEKVVA